MKRQIPTIPPSAVGTDRQPFDTALKENLEVLFGQRGKRLEKLDASASLAEVIAKVNEIIDRLQ